MVASLLLSLITDQVDTAPVQTDVDKFLFTIPEPESVNHFVIFLLGTEPLDPAFGAAVYVAWPAPEPAWNLAGMHVRQRSKCTSIDGAFRVHLQRQAQRHLPPWEEQGDRG